jgi:hypothetical protein
VRIKEDNKIRDKSSKLRRPGRRPKEEVGATLLGGLTGSEVAARVLLFLAINGEGYSQQIAEQLGLTVSGVYLQLLRFEGCGLLVRRNVGRTAMFSFNERGGDAMQAKALVVYLAGRLSLDEQAVLAARRRPRKTGKKLSYDRDRGYGDESAPSQETSAISPTRKGAKPKC